MTLREPSTQRTLPVTLREVRLEVRLAAVRALGASEDLFAAAFEPSDTVYYLRPSGIDLLRKVS